MNISSLKLDAKNCNQGTERGRKALSESLKQYGAGRSILVDKKGRVIAGNKTLEQALAAGHKDVLIVKTDGSKLVAVQRMDLDLKDKTAKALAIADNRVGELDLEWAGDVLGEMAKEIDLEPFFSTKELAKLVGTGVDTEAGAKTLNHGYGVMIEEISEAQQLTLLKKLTKEGFTCRALTF